MLLKCCEGPITPVLQHWQLVEQCPKTLLVDDCSGLHSRQKLIADMNWESLRPNQYNGMTLLVFNAVIKCWYICPHMGGNEIIPTWWNYMKLWHWLSHSIIHYPHKLLVNFPILGLLTRIIFNYTIIFVGYMTLVKPHNFHYVLIILYIIIPIIISNHIPPKLYHSFLLITSFSQSTIGITSL